MTGIGDTLRAARLRRGDDLAACAAATGIGPALLAALEQERFNALPPTAHHADLIARYATHLGLDGPRLAGWAEIHGDPDADTQPIPVVRRPPPRRDSVLVWVGAGAVLGVVGLIVLGGGGPDSEDGTPRTTTRSAATASPPTETAAAGTTARAAPSAPAVIRPVPARSPAIELRLDAQPGKSVWVEVRRRDVGGAQVFAGIVGGGVTRTVRSTTPLWLGIAWAPNLAVTLNGEVLDAEGGTESYRVTARGLTKLASS